MPACVVYPPKFSWGSLLPAVGYSRCWQCRRPWWCAKPRDVEYAPGCGQFALCVPCWGRLPEYKRVAAHAHVCLSGSWTTEERHAIYRAIEQQSREGA